MRRHFARWSFCFSLCCSLTLGLVSVDGIASSLTECLEARLYWQPLTEHLDPLADPSLFDQAALALIKRGRSFGVRSFLNENRKSGDRVSAAATFRAVFSHQDQFVPMFQDRLKELSAGKVEMIPFDGYFKLVRQTRVGRVESYVKLTPEGFAEHRMADTKPKPRRARDVFDEPAEPSQSARDVAREAKRKRSAPALPPELSSVTPAESKKYWSTLPAIKVLGEAAAMEAVQYDRAAISLTHGKAYGVATLKEARFSGESARTAFAHIEKFWDQFIPALQDRVYQLSMGKAQLTSISAQDAGFDIVGHGRFFKLVRNVGRHKEESVVWLTPEGVSVYPAVNHGNSSP
ncbi:MAG: hypothetical protein ACJ763_17480 [Bdellovibrionia bacterium]